MLSKYYDNSSLSDADVLNIRRKVMAPEKVTKRDAEALIKLNEQIAEPTEAWNCLLYTSPSPRDQRGSRMPSSA